jgi:hypothetical protein
MTMASCSAPIRDVNEMRRFWQEALDRLERHLKDMPPPSPKAAQSQTQSGASEKKG